MQCSYSNCDGNGRQLVDSNVCRQRMWNYPTKQACISRWTSARTTRWKRKNHACSQTGIKIAFSSVFSFACSLSRPFRALKKLSRWMKTRFSQRLLNLLDRRNISWLQNIIWLFLVFRVTSIKMNNDDRSNICCRDSRISRVAWTTCRSLRCLRSNVAGSEAGDDQSAAGCKQSVFLPKVSSIYPDRLHGSDVRWRSQRLWSAESSPRGDLAIWCRSIHRRSVHFQSQFLEESSPSAALDSIVIILGSRHPMRSYRDPRRSRRSCDDVQCIQIHGWILARTILIHSAPLLVTD